MKNLKYIFLILIFSGCQKIFHEEDYKISKIGSSEEMDIALNGLYGRLAQYINQPGMPPQYLADDFPNQQYQGSKYSEYGNDFAKVNWQRLYNIITSANNIICQFQNSTIIKNEIKPGLGEAHLLRAYAYFRLVRIFGQVPIVNNIEVNYSLPKSSFKDIYAFIESDLLKAAGYLPVNKAMARIPNQSPVIGSARAMLAEVYLTMGGYPLLDNTKYIQAALVARTVIDSAINYGFDLLPDYANLWDGTDIQNREVVFGLFFSEHGSTKIVHYDTTRYSDGTYSYGTYTTWNFNIETTNSYNFFDAFLSSGTPYYILPEKLFFSSFPASYRKDITFQTIFLSTASTLEFNNSDSIYYTKITKYTPYKSLEWRSDIFYKKFGYYIQYDSLSVLTTFGHRVFDPYDGQYYLISDSTTGKLGKNYYMNMGQSIYIYRYAHVLLNYAEAKARSGQLDASAYEAVNMIRRRANKVDIHSSSKYDLQPDLSAQQFADSVVNERAWEFCAEPEGRWFDLLRLEMIEQLPKLKNYTVPPPIPVFTKSDYFEAIPNGDKVLNPNLK